MDENSTMTNYYSLTMFVLLAGADAQIKGAFEYLNAGIVFPR